MCSTYQVCTVVYIQLVFTSLRMWFVLYEGGEGDYKQSVIPDF